MWLVTIELEHTEHVVVITERSRDIASLWFSQSLQAWTLSSVNRWPQCEWCLCVVSSPDHMLIPNQSLAREMTPQGFDWFSFWPIVTLPWCLKGTPPIVHGYSGEESGSYRIKTVPGDVPGGPMIKTLTSNAEGTGMGTKIPRAQKNKRKKQKQYPNKFNKGF